MRPRRSRLTARPASLNPLSPIFAPDRMTADDRTIRGRAEIETLLADVPEAERDEIRALAARLAYSADSAAGSSSRDPPVESPAARPHRDPCAFRRSRSPTSPVGRAPSRRRRGWASPASGHSQPEERVPHAACEARASSAAARSRAVRPELGRDLRSVQVAAEPRAITSRSRSLRRPSAAASSGAGPKARLVGTRSRRADRLVDSSSERLRGSGSRRRRWWSISALRAIAVSHVRDWRSPGRSVPTPAALARR